MKISLDPHCHFLLEARLHGGCDDVLRSTLRLTFEAHSGIPGDELKLENLSFSDLWLLKRELDRVLA